MIIRTPKDRENPYVMVNKFSIGDPGLTMQAKGLLTYLLSLPNDWEVRPKELVRHFKNGRDAIYSTINELIDACYLKRVQLRKSGNRFSEYEYTVFEFPNNDSASLVPSVLSGVRHPRIRKVRTRGNLQGKIGGMRKRDFESGERGNVDDPGVLDADPMIFKDER